MAHMRIDTPQQRDHHRTHHWSEFAWHAGAFILVNAYLWLLDMTVGQAGVQWSFRITEIWGMVVAAHALVCFAEIRRESEKHKVHR